MANRGHQDSPAPPNSSPKHGLPVNGAQLAVALGSVQPDAVEKVGPDESVRVRCRLQYAQGKGAVMPTVAQLALHGIQHLRQTCHLWAAMPARTAATQPTWEAKLPLSLVVSPAAYRSLQQQCDTTECHAKGHVSSPADRRLQASRRADSMPPTATCFRQGSISGGSEGHSPHGGALAVGASKVMQQAALVLQKLACACGHARAQQRCQETASAPGPNEGNAAAFSHSNPAPHCANYMPAASNLALP